MTTTARTRRIAIDLTPLQPGGLNGGAKPAAFRLVRLIAATDRYAVTVLVRSTYTETVPLDDLANVDIVQVDDRFLQSRAFLTERAEPWSIAHALGCDMLFAPFGDPILSETDVPTVAQRYDLQHLDLPEFFSPEELEHRAAADDRLSRHATRIITSSEFSRSAIIELLGIDAELIAAIPLPLPITPQPIPDETLQRQLAALGIANRPYIYYPANFWPHKNHRRLIEGYAIASKDWPETPDLVLTGDCLARETEIQELAGAHGVGARVHILGFVDERARDAIWQGCRALLFPSLYEGFGIPLQEALVHDKPIAASVACSVPEVGGNAAIYFDPEDPRAIADAIARVVNLGEGREQLRRHRGERLRRFDEAAIATAYTDLFDDVLAATASVETDNHPSVTVVLNAAERQNAARETINSLLSQHAAVAEIILVSTHPVLPEIDRAAETLAPCVTITGATDSERGAHLSAAISAAQGELLLIIESGDRLQPNALTRLTCAASAHPEAWLVHGTSSAILRRDESPTRRTIAPVIASNPATRATIGRSAALVRRRAYDSAGPLSTAAFAFEEIVASYSTDEQSLFVPLEVAHTTPENARPILELSELDRVLRARDVADRGAWLLQVCDEMVEAAECERVGGDTTFQRADRLLWAAPMVFGLAGVDFDEECLTAAKLRWRRARTRDIGSHSINPLQAVLSENPRDSALRGLLGPTVAERVIDTFADRREMAGDQSLRRFRQALADATEDDLSANLRGILKTPDPREFAVSAVEAAAYRTPSAGEVRHIIELAEGAGRLHTLKWIITASIDSDWKAVTNAALAMASTDQLNDNRKIYPLGTEVATTAGEWYASLRRVRAKAIVPPADSGNPRLPPRRSGTTPAVSILCSLYDGDDFIEPYLENLTGQHDFADCELVIVDACSPGNERQVIERFTAQHRNIFYTRTDTRIGIYAAWNLAIQQSSGRYITNANLDDSRDVSSMARFRDALDAHPEIDVVYSDYYYTFIPHLAWNEIESVGLRTQFPPPTKHNMLDFNSPHCAPMWRRSLHERHGYFDETYRSAGDWEFWLRCIRSGLSMHKIDPPLVAYFHNPRGMSTQRNTPSAREEAAIRFAYRDLLISEDAPLDPLANVEDTYSRATPDRA